MMNEQRPHKRPWQSQDRVDHKRIKRQCRELPVFSIRQELMRLFRMHEVIILRGETACGKTTQIPQYVLSGGFAKDLAIAVTQPRRVAAITIAERVATELGTELGDKVGYSVRFDDMTSSSTKIKYVTDGMLLRESISDPLLSSYSWVILDEAHERTIHTDVLFGIVKSAQRTRKEENHPPLQIIVMSATIDEDKLSKYFNGAPICQLPGRKYSITFFNLIPDKEHKADYVIYALSSVFHLHENEPDGDILVFMTGEEEIQWIVDKTEKIALERPVHRLSLKAYGLYAALPSHLQLTALKPSPPLTRKVIYSTNIAETSLTIPGVKYVIDSGMVKVRSFNSTSGFDVLKVQRISKAQAEQRMGRAGRECEGSCYQLYTKEDFDNLADFPIPEIQRCNLSTVLLQVIAIGISDIRTFDFLDRPSDENINAAIEQLVLLGAVEEDDEGKVHLTECGKLMVNFPLDPRFSKMIVTSPKFKCTDEILSIISMLSVDSIFLPSPNAQDNIFQLQKRFFNGEGDHMFLLNLYKAFRAARPSKEWCISNNVNYKTMKKAMAIRKQLSQICQRVNIRPCCAGPDRNRVLRCLTAGLFMNSAYLNNGTYKAIGSKQEVFVHPSSCMFKCVNACFIYTDLIVTTKCYMRNVTFVREDWLLDTAPEYFRTRGFKKGTSRM